MSPGLVVLAVSLLAGLVLYLVTDSVLWLAGGLAVWAVFTLWRTRNGRDDRAP